MPPQLRLRLSPSPSSSPNDLKNQELSLVRSNSKNVSSLHHRACSSASSSNNGITPSSSFDNLNGALSSQSLHQALHPPPSTTTPLKRPTNTNNMLQPMFRTIMTKSGSMKVRPSTFLIVGMVVLLGTMQRLHYLAMKSVPDDHGKVHQLRNLPYNLQKERIRTLGRHPRIFQLQDDLPEFDSLWHRLFAVIPILRRRSIKDPMLHHEGWRPSKDEGGHVIDNININEQGEAADEEEEPQQCVPMAKWQTTSYPNCNTVHEIDMVRSSGPGSFAFPEHNPQKHTSPKHNRRKITSHPSILLKFMDRVRRKYSDDESLKKKAKLTAQGIVKEETLEFLGQGWFRSAWEMYVEGMHDWDEYEEDWRYEESVVLKTLRIERDFLEEYYELHRRDALAMERLTFSPYVLNIYGYCGQSAINELANFGIEGMSSLEKVARSFRGMDDIEPVSKIKLQLASMVAAGVSHMHSVDYADFPYRDFDSSDDADGEMEKEFQKTKLASRVKSNATLVHYDLNPRNIAIIRKGKPKLNDFNVAEFLTWDTKNNQTCGFKGRFREPWWRAPEEMQNRMDEYPDTPLTEKVDIYSLGNILWDILTSHSPWGKMTKERMEEVRPKVARGELPTWPSDFNKTKLETDPALRAIERAMQKCLRLKPEDRPTAGEIADELHQAIANLPEGFGDKEKWRQEMRDKGKRTDID